jgi:hypothetical protein
MNSNVKTETLDFNVFSVEHVNDAGPMNSVKSEPTVSVDLKND